MAFVYASSMNATRRLFTSRFPLAANSSIAVSFLFSPTGSGHLAAKALAMRALCAPRCSCCRTCVFIMLQQPVEVQVLVMPPAMQIVHVIQRAPMSRLSTEASSQLCSSSHARSFCQPWAVAELACLAFVLGAQTPRCLLVLFFFFWLVLSPSVSASSAAVCSLACDAGQGAR